MLFFAVVIVPATRAPELAQNGPVLIRVLGRRYRVFAWSALAVLLVSGVTNLLLRGFDLPMLLSSEFWRSSFGRTLSYKLFFVALVLGSTGAHDLWMGTRESRRAGDDPGTAAARAYRKRASWLGRSTLLFSMIVLYFAVSLVRGIP